MAAAKKPNAPWTPVSYSEKEVRYIQALARGDATPEQQRGALDWIINSVCGTYDLPYYPESIRDSDFAQGKRFVGLQLVKMLKIISGNLDKPQKG